MKVCISRINGQPYNYLAASCDRKVRDKFSPLQRELLESIGVEGKFSMSSQSDIGGLREWESWSAMVPQAEMPALTLVRRIRDLGFEVDIC